MIGELHLGLQNKLSWWRPKEGELFDVFSSFQKIGSCGLALVDSQLSPRKEEQFFPDSWFMDKKTEKMRHVLEVTVLEAFQQKKMGNGRLCLQALYDLSHQKGCGGRIQVFADLGSVPFYEHCGFKGGTAGKNGLKYFDPTPQNLSLLFPTGESQMKCQFIPISSRSSVKVLSQTNKVLFNNMLQKGQRS